MKLSNIKRLVQEDFPSQYQDLVGTLAYSLNPMIDQINQIFQGNVTIGDNLNQQLVSTTVTTVKGAPTPKLMINTPLPAQGYKVSGVIALSASPASQTNPPTYPISAPFVSWSINSNIITVNNISGLQDNVKYNFVFWIVTT